MKVFWITKYALTKGVFAITAEVSRHGDVEYAKGTEPYGLFCRIGKDAFENESDAIHDAAERARKKIKAIEKQTKSLRAKLTEWSRPVLPSGDFQEKTK